MNPLRCVPLTFALCLGLGFPVLAQPASSLHQGILLHSRGEYRQSIEVLERAARHDTDPKQLGQIYLHLGFNRALLGEQAAAEGDLVTALEQDADLEPDPRRFRSDLLQLFQRVRGRLGLLEITTDRGGAALSIDRRSRGSLPARVRLPGGSHLIEVRLGSMVQTRTVSVSGGQTLAVRFTLPLPELPSAPATAPSPAMTRPSLPSATVEPSPRRAPPSFWGRRRVWTWITAASAVAAAGAGLGTWLWARSKWENDWNTPLNTYCPKDMCPSSAEQQTLKDLKANIKGDINARSDAAAVLFGVAGGLAVTSAVLLFFEGRPKAERAGSSAFNRLTFLPLAGGAAASLTGEF
jgi:tetratricopeptide (TPR) repeat protein